MPSATFEDRIQEHRFTVFESAKQLHNNYFMNAIRLLVLAALLGAWGCTEPSVDGPDGPEKPQDGLVQGRVVDDKGNGVANAQIIASSTDYLSKTTSGYTDAKGNYRFKLPTNIAEGSYAVSGYVTLKYHNKNYKMALYEENTRVFSAYEGAIRNFVFRLTGKRTVDDDDRSTPLGGTLEVHHQVDNVVFENLEITLEPVGPLVDGSTGKKIVTMMPQSGYEVKDIPVGNYKITARDKVTGQKLGVTIHNSFKDYAPSVTGLFEDDDFIGSTNYRLIILVNTL